MPLSEAEQGQLDDDGGRGEQGGARGGENRSRKAERSLPPGWTVIDDEAEARKSKQIRSGETGRRRGGKTRKGCDRERETTLPVP